MRTLTVELSPAQIRTVEAAAALHGLAPEPWAASVVHALSHYWVAAKSLFEEGRSKGVTVELTWDEYVALDRIAKGEGKTAAWWLRDRVLEAVQERSE